MYMIPNYVGHHMGPVRKARVSIHVSGVFYKKVYITVIFLLPPFSFSGTEIKSFLDTDRGRSVSWVKGSVGVYDNYLCGSSYGPS